MGIAPMPWLHLSQVGVRNEAMDDPEQTTVILMLWPLLDGCSAAKKVTKKQWSLKGKQNWSGWDMCLTVTITHSSLSIKGLSPEGRSREIPTKASNCFLF